MFHPFGHFGFVRLRRKFTSRQRRAAVTDSTDIGRSKTSLINLKEGGLVLS
jgi:hypothetical protein